MNAWAEIDLLKLKNNINIIKNNMKNKTKLGAVIKANAYGLGAVRISNYLEKNKLVDMFIVGKKIEAIELIKNNIKLPILILDDIYISDIENESSDFIYSAYSIDFLKELDMLALKKNKVLKCHLRIDINSIGMGIGIQEFIKYQKEIFKLKHIKIEGIYSHLYSSYTFDEERILRELNLFDNVINQISKDIRDNLIVHICNSALFFKYQNYHYNMVRIGTAIYGLPCSENDNYKLETILSLKAKVVDVYDINSNTNISYKNTSCKNLKIARILFGYWDLPMIMTRNNMKVLINGKLANIVDEPCMDNSCIDVSFIENVKKDDEVTILGSEKGITIYDILKYTNINFVHSEWVCIISNRLYKKYIYGGNINE